MPPKSLRSRACSQCRTRRVKCDETPETCNQCRRLGLHCSGPIQGSIVIDMTERVVKPRTKKKREPARALAAVSNETGGQPAAKIAPKPVTFSSLDKPVAPLGMLLQSQISPIKSSCAEEVEKAITAIRYHYRPPTFNQPSRALPEALDNAFITHYIELNKGEKSYAPELQWLGHVQSIFNHATKPVIRMSLRAVSMAFYGKHHNDSSIIIDSWRWYTVALSAQRSSVARMKKNVIPDEGEVLVPLILALYELYAGATATGSMAHLNAAGEIMKMRGPSNCRSGAIWPLFQAVRNQDAHRSIIFNTKSAYSSPDWMTIPFLNMPRDPHQGLADVELMIPHCTAFLGIEGPLRVVFETKIPPEVDVTPGKELASKLIADLDNWAEEYPHLTKPSMSSKTTPTPESSSQSPREKSPRPATAGAFAALICSNYMADRVVLNMLMYRMQTEASAPSVLHERTAAHYLSEAQRYSEAMMQFAAEIEKAQTPGLDVLRSITPVLTVGYCAPTAEVRNAAKMMIFRWTSKISGLASALDRA